MMDIFEYTWICGFKNILNIIEVNNYFVGILKSLIVLPMKYLKLNVQ